MTVSRSFTMKRPSLLGCGANEKLFEDGLAAVESVMIHAVGGERVSECGIAARAGIDHLTAGGRRVRARLALQAGEALGLSVNDSVIVAATVELLHNASLVHDDLQDREKSRRGVQTVWAAHGDEIAICTGDLLLSSAYGVLSKFSDCRKLPDLIKQAHDCSSKVIRGQCAELSARGKQVTDMAVYEGIAAGKSGALLGLPLELGLIASDHHAWLSEAERAARSFGIAYQIRDDIEDVVSDAMGEAGPRAVNALLVLRAGGHGQNAEAVAREIGLYHIRSAIESAGRLPNGAGGFLRELAQGLSNQLLTKG